MQYAKKKIRHVRYQVAGRIITIQGSIRASTPNLLKKALDAVLKNRKSRKRRIKVLIYIKSSGGLFYSAVKAHKIISLEQRAVIRAIACDFVDSCAMIILQGGDKRLALPNTTFHIHRTEILPPQRRINVLGLRQLEFECLEKDSAFKLILLERGRPVQKIIKLFDNGAELTAEEARKLKLIDKIITPKRWTT